MNATEKVVIEAIIKSLNSATITIGEEIDYKMWVNIAKNLNSTVKSNIFILKELLTIDEENKNSHVNN